MHNNGGERLPSHPLTIDVTGSSKAFHMGDVSIWYTNIPNPLARAIDKTIGELEVCFSLVWDKYGDKVPSITEVIGEFVRTVEYGTAMVSRYKHEHTLEVEINEVRSTIIITFAVTSCY